MERIGYPIGYVDLSAVTARIQRNGIQSYPSERAWGLFDLKNITPKNASIMLAREQLPLGELVLKALNLFWKKV